MDIFLKSQNLGGGIPNLLLIMSKQALFPNGAETTTKTFFSQQLREGNLSLKVFGNVLYTID